jgi:hypothetical protein
MSITFLLRTHCQRHCEHIANVIANTLPMSLRAASAKQSQRGQAGCFGEAISARGKQVVSAQP